MLDDIGTRSAAVACLCMIFHACAEATASPAPATSTSHSRDGRPARFVVMPGCVTSHWYQSLAIIKELSHRGHAVQVVLTDEFAVTLRPGLAKLSGVNILSYNTSGTDEMAIRQEVREFQRAVGLSSMRDIFGLPKHSHPLLHNTEVRRRIQQFAPDLALIDVVLAGGAALADKLGIPKAILCIAGNLAPIPGHTYGSGSNLLSTVPQWGTQLPQRMNFLQRVQNVFGHLAIMSVWRGVIEPHMNRRIWQQYNIPPYSYVKSNRQVALVLLHGDWATANAEPMAPHIVTIGALTAAPARALPSDLQDFMQSAGEHGVVYASLGTTAIPEAAELIQIAQGLSAIAPTKALWKLSESDLVAFGNGSLPVGSNVKIVQWAPQNDVLGHPSVKAFFTQGGANSFNEASYHGVPFVGMPLCGEQPENIARAEHRGYGLSINVKKLDTLAKDLEVALKRILADPSFSASAARVSNLMQSHRQTPAERAVDALEHAAWTKGSRYMQPLRDDLNWFQHNSLDVMLFIIGTALTALTLAAILLVTVGKKLLNMLRKHWPLQSRHAKVA